MKIILSKKYRKRMKGVFATLLSGVALTLGSLSAAAAPQPEAADSVATEYIATPLEGKAKSEAINRIIAGYSNWGSVAFSGKLKSSLLPLTAGVKIYMEKDKLSIVSVTAPFVGEAVRIEIDKEKILLVNKITRKYTTLTTEEVASTYKGALEDFQNMILGRITLANYGVLRQLNADKVNVIADGSDTWAILPKEEYQPKNFVYAYAFNTLNDMLEQLVVYGANDNLVEADYSWEGAGINAALTLDVTARIKQSVYDGTLILGSPEWGAKPIQRITLDNKYQQSTLRETTSLKR